jgi:hypothetical protein
VYLSRQRIFAHLWQKPCDYPKVGEPTRATFVKNPWNYPKESEEGLVLEWYPSPAKNAKVSEGGRYTRR